VDDFAEITPDLLRTAYVEALYRAEEFEFERLTQSFWWNLIHNISRSMKNDLLFEKFPIEADEWSFRRPHTSFSCHQTNSCGSDTKRIPKVSC
jgi:hypothetical protein